MDACAAALIDADKGTTSLDGEVNNFADFLAVDFAEGSAEDSPRDDLIVPRDHWEAVVSCRLTDALARSTTATAARATAVMMTGR